MQNLYLQLSYDDYKRVEDQLKRFEELERTHHTPDCYHKSFRLQISNDLILEFQGPLVKTQPVVE